MKYTVVVTSISFTLNPDWMYGIIWFESLTQKLKKKKFFFRKLLIQEKEFLNWNSWFKKPKFPISSYFCSEVRKTIAARWHQSFPSKEYYWISVKLSYRSRRKSFHYFHARFQAQSLEILNLCYGANHEISVWFNFGGLSVQAGKISRNTELLSWRCVISLEFHLILSQDGEDLRLESFESRLPPSRPERRFSVFLQFFQNQNKLDSAFPKMSSVSRQNTRDFVLLSLKNRRNDA